MQELLEIISKIGGQYAMVSASKLIKYPSAIPPAPPMEFDDAFDKAIEFMDNGENQ